MMKVKLQDGMRFQHNPLEEGNEFYVKKYDFYDNGELIWCAVNDHCIYPIDEICLDEYMPMLDGKWVNEPVEYEF